MLMSGAIKIQTRGPTWLALSALDFYYAAQSLPLPMAWYAHQVHVRVARPRWRGRGKPGAALDRCSERLADCEPLGHRLRAAYRGSLDASHPRPHPALRRLSAAMQTLLQIAIALTGNYNFFTLSTAAMPQFKVETLLILKNGALSRGYAWWIARGACFRPIVECRRS